MCEYFFLLPSLRSCEMTMRERYHVYVWLCVCLWPWPCAYSFTWRLRRWFSSRFVRLRTLLSACHRRHTCTIITAVTVIIMFVNYCVTTVTIRSFSLITGFCPLMRFALACLTVDLDVLAEIKLVRNSVSWVCVDDSS